MSNFYDSSYPSFSTTDNLIIYSKCIDLTQSRILSRLQKSQHIKFLSLQLNISEHQKRNNTILFLYYKGDLNQPDINWFICLISYITKPNINVNIEFLTLLYNIIELEYQYKKYSIYQLRALLSKLNECNRVNKNFIEYHLFDYYLFYLNYAIKKYDKCHNIAFNSIIDRNENFKRREEENFKNYLKLRINIILCKINLSLNEKTPQAQNENQSLLKEVYEELKPLNVGHSSKIGILLSNVYVNQYRYNEAYLLLVEMYYNIKNKLTKGIAIKCPQELFLQILSRTAYIVIFLGFEMEMMKMTKKYYKNYLLLTQYEPRFSDPLVKGKYGYCLAMLQMIIGNSTCLNKETSDLITSYHQKSKGNKNYIINTYLFDQSNSQFREIFNNQLRIASAFLTEFIINEKLLFSWFIVYNATSIETQRLAEEDINMSNEAMIKQHVDIIKGNADLILNSVKTLITKDKTNPIFQLVYVRIAFIRIAFCKCYCAFIDNNKNAFNNELAIVEKMKSDLIRTDPLARKEYSLITKLKGDFAYKNENYEEAVSCYKEALKNSSTKKTKALIYFNLGLAYFFSKDIFHGRKYTNLSLNEYHEMLLNRTINTPNQDMILQKKIAIIEQIVNRFLLIEGSIEF